MTIERHFAALRSTYVVLKAFDKVADLTRPAIGQPRADIQELQ